MITVITVTFNSAATIAETLKSIADQKFQDVEVIIVDGGSTDETLHVISGFSFPNMRVVSEPDDGIYDAMNKGIGLASGEIISILNSDDVYASSDVLGQVAHTFESHPCDLVYGDISFFEEDQSVSKRIWKAGERKSFSTSWHPPHPGLFVRRSVYQNFGSFDTSFKLAGDFEFMFRVFHRYQLRAVYLPQVMVNMRLGGASTSSAKSVLDGMKEISRAFQANGERVPTFYFLRRYLSKLLQFKTFSRRA